jgi:hypothetical protein
MGFRSLTDAWSQQATANVDVLRSFFETDCFSDLYELYKRKRTVGEASELTDSEIRMSLSQPGFDFIRREWTAVMKDGKRFKRPLNEFSDDVISEFSFGAIFETLQTHAPTLVQLLTEMTEKPVYYESTKDPELQRREHNRHIVTALSILGNRASNRFNPIQAPLGYTCFAAKTPKRIIKILNHLGICPSYDSMLLAIKSNGEKALQRLLEVASCGEAFWMSFDNLHALASVRDFRLFNKASFMVLTCGYVVIPPASRGYKGFFLRFHCDYNRLLSLTFRDFLPSGNVRTIIANAYKSMIYATLRKLSGKSTDWPAKAFPMPEIYSIDHLKPSEILPLPTYDLNEGIVNEVITLHARLAQQVGWTPEMAEKYILPFKGDFATVEANRWVFRIHLPQCNANVIDAQSSGSPRHRLALDSITSKPLLVSFIFRFKSSQCYLRIIWERIRTIIPWHAGSPTLTGIHGNSGKQIARM